MAKRLTVALACAAATFAVGAGPAAAQARTLSYGTAKELAKQLARQQVRGRDVISFHLLKGHRASANRVEFPYDDRTAGNVFCTARIVVTSTTTGRTTRIRARFAGERCAGIPTEVRRFEALTRAAQRGLRRHTAATLDALDRVGGATRRCRAVKVPRSKARDAKALFDIAVVEALEQPNDAALGDFATGLVNVHARIAALAAGADGWADYLTVVRSLPTVDDPCAALKGWKRAGFTDGSAPIDFAGYRSLSRRAGRDRRAITRAANVMAARGAFPNAALAFTTDGMLLRLASRVGVAAG